MSSAEIRKRLQQLQYATQQQQAHHGNWNYREVRPLPVVHVPSPNNETIDADCSFGVKLLCYSAGAPDPTGFNYASYGNTVSIYQHLPHIDLGQALPGDIVLYGPGGSDHACMLYQWHDGRCWVWSHGHQGAPEIVTLGAMSAYFGPECPVTWCQTLRPDPTPHAHGNPARTGHPPKEKK